MAGTIACNAEDSTGDPCLNGVRPRWPEQSETGRDHRITTRKVSMESGLDGRNNVELLLLEDGGCESQWSPA